MAKVLDRRKALLLFSGGQDSTVCLGLALGQYEQVYTLGFDYGQRHRSELVCRKRILELAARLPWSGTLGGDLVLDMQFFKALGASALTSEKEITTGDDGFPNTFVPGRNLFFLTAAAAYAYSLGIGTIIGGMGEADYSGYPDCREHTIDALATALNLGMDAEFDVRCPLMHKDKESIWRMAEELGGTNFLDIVRRETHTCYLDQRTLLHDWGYGCGECPACVLRKNGYHKYTASRIK